MYCLHLALVLLAEDSIDNIVTNLAGDIFLKFPDFWDYFGYFCRNIDSAIR